MKIITVCVGGRFFLKCLEVKMSDSSVVLADKTDSRNKINISREDWNELVSQIRKGLIKEI